MERLFSAPEDDPDIISVVIYFIYELFLNYLLIIVHQHTTPTPTWSQLSSEKVVKKP